jgi:hypothetical protein
VWNCLTIIRSNGGFITGCTANGDGEVLRARLDLNFRGLLIRDSSVQSIEYRLTHSATTNHCTHNQPYLPVP